MDFTFGIITAGGYDDYIKTCVESIREEKIPHYEIIIVGDTSIKGDDITNIPFDESVKAGWITRKKNIIVSNAKYENIVLLHDYLALQRGWYQGFLTFGNDFDICVNKIMDIFGRRFRDMPFFDSFHTLNLGFGNLVPFNYEPHHKLNKLLYISGTYYVIKKNIALKYPLDESLCHNMGEDVILCQLLASNNVMMKMNPNSTVYLLKDKFSSNVEIEKEELDNLLNMDDEEIEFIFQRNCFLQRKFAEDVKATKQPLTGTI